MKAAANNDVDYFRVNCVNSLKNEVGGWNMSTSLMLSAEAGHVDILRLLIGMKAELNLINKLGNTAIMCASEQGHLEAVQELAHAGADTQIKNCYGQNAIILATEVKTHMENRNVIDLLNDLFNSLFSIIGKPYRNRGFSCQF